MLPSFVPFFLSSFLSSFRDTPTDRVELRQLPGADAERHVDRHPKKRGRNVCRTAQYTLGYVLAAIHLLLAHLAHFVRIRDGARFRIVKLCCRYGAELPLEAYHFPVQLAIPWRRRQLTKNKMRCGSQHHIYLS